MVKAPYGASFRMTRIQLSIQLSSRLLFSTLKEMKLGPSTTLSMNSSFANATDSDPSFSISLGGNVIVILSIVSPFHLLDLGFDHRCLSVRKGAAVTRPLVAELLARWICAILGAEVGRPMEVFWVTGLGGLIAKEQHPNDLVAEPRQLIQVRGADSPILRMSHVRLLVEDIHAWDGVLEVNCHRTPFSDGTRSVSSIL
jgi:hypothetical protein